MTSTRTIRTATAAGALIASIALTAGCSVTGTAISDSDPRAVSSGGGSAAKVDGPPPGDLVLTAADLPAGYTLTEIPADQYEKILEQTRKSAKTTKVTPEHCARPQFTPESTDPAKFGYIASSNAASSTLAESVAFTTQSIEEIEKLMTGDCAKITMTLNSGPAAGVTSDTEYTLLTPPKTAADDIIVVEQKTVAKIDGKESPATMLLAVAIVGGYTMAVSSGGLGAPDRAAFDAMVVAGVAKIDANS